MKKYIIGLGAICICCLLTNKALGQADSVYFDVKDIKYKPVTEDYFADYKGAKFILNYYCSDGWSASNRYSFQVVVIDSLLMVGFDSPETDGLRYTSFEKRTILSKRMLDSLKNILGDAGLKQKREGIPEPNGTSNTKEVLLVRYGNLNIAGGMFYYNMLQEDASTDKINTIVQRERNLTSSIGGDYDMVIQTLVSLFPDLNSLRTQVVKR